MPVAGGTPRDLTAGADYDVPPREREGPHPIAFAPDSRTICFTAVTDAVEATSTNGDLFEVGCQRRVRRQAADEQSRLRRRACVLARRRVDCLSLAGARRLRSGQVAVDDASIASRAEYVEPDRRLRSKRGLTARGQATGPRSTSTPRTAGRMPVFSVPLARRATPRATLPKALTPGMYTANSPSPERSTRRRAQQPRVASRARGHRERGQIATDPRPQRGAPRRHSTWPNRSRSRSRCGGDQVQGFLVKPPAFDPSKKYPVLMLLHGGPQTQWSDAWSYRWNAQMFASPGYVVVMINSRGSTGFGQPFTDHIALDWGGKPFEDLMKGLDFVTSRYAFADAQRVAAAGASYGGYMIDWLASHSKGRFRALVSHAGVYNLTSMYGATEELWFPERDFGGVPWTAAGTYEKLSPHTYAAEFGKYKTPTLVIAGEQDYRVPYTQSLEFFHGAATTRCAFKTCGLSRRGTLDPETAKQPALVQARCSAGSKNTWASSRSRSDYLSEIPAPITSKTAWGLPGSPDCGGTSLIS